jgi:hypothetical protein
MVLPPEKVSFRKTMLPDSLQGPVTLAAKTELLFRYAPSFCLLHRAVACPPVS